MPTTRAAPRGLLRTDFSYALPPELIASEPTPARRGSRLLALDGLTGAWRDLLFPDLGSLLRPGDLLVRNDTRVLPARLHGTKATGGAVEILIERIIAERRFTAQLRSSKGARPGQSIALALGANALVVALNDELVELELDRPVAAYLEAAGEVPLPPYIDRAATSGDRERYQTVYARASGAVAAPTAGLHFDAEFFASLGSRGIGVADVTLHVGAGTFQPVRSLELDQHRMHAEWLEVPAATVEAIVATRRAGGRVVAIGTTVVRSLETAAAGGELEAFQGETRLFITPGYRFRVIDALVTNFHVPESTLLMLVCAFAGREQVLGAYAHAVAARYRFFSYGDAMFVTPAPGAARSA